MTSIKRRRYRFWPLATNATSDLQAAQAAFVAGRLTARARPPPAPTLRTKRKQPHIRAGIQKVDSVVPTTGAVAEAARRRSDERRRLNLGRTRVGQCHPARRCLHAERRLIGMAPHSLRIEDALRPSHVGVAGRRRRLRACRRCSCRAGLRPHLNTGLRYIGRLACAMRSVSGWRALLLVRRRRPQQE